MSERNLVNLEGDIYNQLERSSLLNAVLGKLDYHLEEKQTPLHIDDWFAKHPEVFRDGKFYTQNGEEAKLIILFAGTSAGKTTFVTKTLPVYGRVYFNCSRVMIKKQQISKNQTLNSGKSYQFSETNQLVIGTSWDLSFAGAFREAKKADYIVIDEAHHLVSDTFCDASAYAYELLLKAKLNQTIILMTACAEYFEKAINDAPYSYGNGDCFDLPIKPVLVLDLRECCINLYPNRIDIISDKNAEHIINNGKMKDQHVIYYCTSAKKAYKLACEATIRGLNAIALTSSTKYQHQIINRYVSKVVSHSLVYINRARGKQNFKQSSTYLAHDIERLTRQLLDLPKRAKQVNLALIDHEKIPDDIDIIYTTSRLREGLNISRVSRRVSVFTELIDPVSIVQIAGRIRKPENSDYKFDCLYIMVDPNQSEKGDNDVMYMHKNLSFVQDYKSLYNEFFSEKLNEIGKSYFDDFSLQVIHQQHPQEKNKSKSEIALPKAKKQIHRLYDQIDHLYKLTGQWKLKPFRDKYNDEISGFEIETNQLWFVNARVMHDSDFWIRPRSINECSEYVAKVSQIFPRSQVSVDLRHSDLRKKELPDYDKHTVLEIIRKYVYPDTNQYISGADREKLKAELIEANFIAENSRMWKAIRKLGFNVQWKNSKRQEYRISELAVDKVEVL